MDAHQTEIYTAVLIAGFLLGGIILFFIVSLVQHQKRNLELHRKNIFTEITTLEKEHLRLARDLHDELAPLLTGIKFNLISLDIKSEEQYIVDRALKGIDEAILRIREIAKGLMPESLTERGLQHALEDFIILLNAPLKIELQYGITMTLSKDRELNIFRLLKEIIQNTLKHSGAHRLVIRLGEERNRLFIISEDDGVGFDESRTKDSGIGLRNLRSRTELMGGWLELYTKTGVGTQYKIWIPKKEKEKA